MPKVWLKAMGDRGKEKKDGEEVMQLFTKGMASNLNIWGHIYMVEWALLLWTFLLVSNVAIASEVGYHPSLLTRILAWALIGFIEMVLVLASCYGLIRFLEMKGFNKSK